MVTAEGGAVGCALLKRSNRTASNPVITGLLTVLLEYIDLSAEMQPLTVLVSLLHQQHLH